MQCGRDASDGYCNWWHPRSGLDTACTNYVAHTIFGFGSHTANRTRSLQTAFIESSGKSIAFTSPNFCTHTYHFEFSMLIYRLCWPSIAIIWPLQRYCWMRKQRKWHWALRFHSYQFPHTISLVCPELISNSNAISSFMQIEFIL